MEKLQCGLRMAQTYNRRDPESNQESAQHPYNSENADLYSDIQSHNSISFSLNVYFFYFWVNLNHINSLIRAPNIYCSILTEKSSRYIPQYPLAVHAWHSFVRLSFH